MNDRVNDQAWAIPGRTHKLVPDKIQLGNDADDVEVDTPGKQKVPELHRLL
jgi:hypothetical protein